MSPFANSLGKASIEELTVSLGMEVSIKVWYSPERKHQEDLKVNIKI